MSLTWPEAAAAWPSVNVTTLFLLFSYVENGFRFSIASNVDTVSIAAAAAAAAATVQTANARMTDSWESVYLAYRHFCSSLLMALRT